VEAVPDVTVALGRAAALTPRGRLAAQLLVLDLPCELAQAAPEVAAHGRRGELLGEPAEDARPATPYCKPQLDVRAALAPRAQPPAAALVDAGDRRPGQVALGRELDDLDQPPTSAEPTRISIR
jgi:hypothetical protein